MYEFLVEIFLWLVRLVLDPSLENHLFISNTDEIIQSKWEGNN